MVDVLAWLPLVYVVVLAMYGQTVLVLKCIAWLDKRYGQPWLKRRLRDG